MSPAGPEEGCWHALGSPRIEQAGSAVEGLLRTSPERAGERWESQGGAATAPKLLSELAAVAKHCPVPCPIIGGLGMLGMPRALIKQRCDDEQTLRAAWGGSCA